MAERRSVRLASQLESVWATSGVDVENEQAHVNSLDEELAVRSAACDASLVKEAVVARNLREIEKFVHASS